MDIETEGLTPGRTVPDVMRLWGKDNNCFFVNDVDDRELVSQWVKDMKSFCPNS